MGFAPTAQSRCVNHRPGPYHVRENAGVIAGHAAQFLQFCYDTLAEQRRERSLGDGVLLATLHGAKGMEFPHLLIADVGWRQSQRGQIERRLFYVGMTRVGETLTLGRVLGGDPAFREHCQSETWELPLVEICVRAWDLG